MTIAPGESQPEHPESASLVTPRWTRMRFVRCEACGAKALVAASGCPACGHSLGLRNSRGEPVPLAHCPNCDLYYPRQLGECRWCGTEASAFHIAPYLWGGAGFVLLIGMAWAAWQVHSGSAVPQRAELAGLPTSAPVVAEVTRPETAATSPTTAESVSGETTVRDTATRDTTSRPSTGESQVYTAPLSASVREHGVPAPSERRDAVVPSPAESHTPVVPSPAESRAPVVPSPVESRAPVAPSPVEGRAAVAPSPVERGATVAPSPVVSESPRTPVVAGSRKPVTSSRGDARKPSPSSRIASAAPRSASVAPRAPGAAPRTSSRAPSPSRNQRWVSATVRKWANVRADASAGSRVVAAIGPDTRVQLGETRDGWQRLRARDISGWVEQKGFVAQLHGPVARTALGERR
jgi:hypothetical protein